MKLALITGATKGIGRSTAITLANSGWDLILLARNINLLEELKTELSNSTNKINIISCDLSDPESVELSITKLVRDFGCPNVVINNAGFAFNSDLLGMPLEEWQKIFQVNLTSIFQICSLVVPKMRKEGGLIINVSSHAAYNAFPKWGAYCVTKAALVSFTKCLREEERSKSIRACTITLGSVNTPLWDSEFVDSDFDRSAMLSSNRVSQVIRYIAEQPNDQLIEDLTLMPSKGVF